MAAHVTEGKYTQKVTIMCNELQYFISVGLWLITSGCIATQGVEGERGERRGGRGKGLQVGGAE